MKNLLRLCSLWAAVFTLNACGSPGDAATTVRIAAAQPKRRSVDWHIRDPREVLVRVDDCLRELVGLIDQAAAQKCRAIAFPEDTLGLGVWEADNHEVAATVLSQGVNRMLSSFGAAAEKHRMYVVCCNHAREEDGAIYNTAFLLGPDGRQLGKYHKVCLTIHEGSCKPGDSLPVFHTPDLGDVGMLICWCFPRRPVVSP